MSKRIYMVNVFLSREMIELGWPAFWAVRAQVMDAIADFTGRWPTDGVSMDIEHRHYGDWGKGLILASFKIKGIEAK